MKTRYDPVSISRILFLTSLSIWAAGCGFVFIPVVEKFPDSFDRLEVRDATTREEIPFSHVEYYVAPIVRIDSFPHDQFTLLSGGVPGAAIKTAKTDGFNKQPKYFVTEQPVRGLEPASVEEVLLTPAGPGCFECKPISKLAFLQCWWPLFLSHSTYFWKRGYASAILIHAPDHYYLNLRFGPGESSPPFYGNIALTNEGEFAGYYEQRGGTLTFYIAHLPRRGD